MKGYATITALVCLFTIFSIIPGYIAWGDVWWYVRHTSLFREPTQQGSSIAGDIASPSLAVVEPVRSFMTAFYWGTRPTKGEDNTWRCLTCGPHLRCGF